MSTYTAKQNLRAYGFRLKGRIKTNFDYSAEVALEDGADGPERIQAWATTDGVAYQFDSLPGRPRAFVQYDFASGNGDPAHGIHRTFDTIYPTAHDRFGILDLFGWQNIQSVRGGATVIPRRRWTVTAQYLSFWLASAKDAVYSSSGTAIGYDISGRSGAYVGEEADSYTWYELNRHVNIGGGVGWFGAGHFLASVTTGHMYSTSYITINFKDAGGSESR